MGTSYEEPNWSLVTEQYQVPASFTELLALLTPKRPSGKSTERAILEWKEEQFYKPEHLMPFLYHAIHTMRALPRFQRDEFTTILRVIHLCQEAGWYEKAHDLLEEEGVARFVQTALCMEEWDAVKVAAAWNYLIVKRKAGTLSEADHEIWERVKFNDVWLQETPELVSQKAVLEFTFAYMCDCTKKMTSAELNQNLMGLAIYCNTYLMDLHRSQFFASYEAYMKYAAHYEPDEAVLVCQRAVLAQLCDLLDQKSFYHYDLINELGDLMAAADVTFLQQYDEFVGKLLSYIPFFELMRVPSHVQCMENLLFACKGDDLKEGLLRQYVFPYIRGCFVSFLRYFLRRQRYESIHEILFYWCSEEQRRELEQTYNLSVVYEKYISG